MQGFGNVGSYAAEGMAKYGSRIVGISDVSGGVYNPKGLDLKALEDHVKATGSVGEVPGGDHDFQRRAAHPAVRNPHPRGDGPRHHGEERGQAPVPHSGRGRERPHHRRGRRHPAPAPGDFRHPDILCNSGGVIVSYFEWVQDLQSFFWAETEIFDKLYRILDRTLTTVLKQAKKHNVDHRTAALSLGIQKVVEAKAIRGLFP